MTGSVLVVGGGIAGLAAVAALSRRGIPARLVDRQPGPPEAGLGLNLPGNAVRALGALGLAEAVSRLGVPVRRREYRNAKGRLLFAVDEAAFWGPGAGSVCVRRGELLELLLAAAPAGAVRWGTPVTTVTTAGASVEVHLADGSADTYDLVVGADGVNSVVRRAILGADAARPSLLTAASWRFVTENSGVGCWTVWSGPTGTLLLLPVDTDHVYGYASATQGGPVAADPGWLAATFAHFPDPVPQVVAAALADPTSLYHSPVTEVRGQPWSRGRVVLIGDAAHATAPVWAQGAALAVEDALMLADLMGSRPDWAGVGAEYERRRRPRVEHVQRMTDRLSRAAGLPGWLRDTILPLLGPRSYRETYGPLREPVV